MVGRVLVRYLRFEDGTGIDCWLGVLGRIISLSLPALVSMMQGLLAVDSLTVLLYMGRSWRRFSVVKLYSNEFTGCNIYSVVCCRPLSSYSCF